MAKGIRTILLVVCAGIS